MRALIVPAIAMAMSVSSASVAQSQPSGGQSSQPMSTRSYKDVVDAMKQAGIQNVRTLNAAYLVSVVTQGGEQVTFVVDPPIPGGPSSSNGSVQPGASSGQQGSGLSSASSGQQAGSSGQQLALLSQQQVRDSLTNADLTKVQILDVACLATGKTQNGDMMIDPSARTGATGSTGSGSQASPGQSGSTSKP